MAETAVIDVKAGASKALEITGRIDEIGNLEGAAGERRVSLKRQFLKRNVRVTLYGGPGFVRAATARIGEIVR